MSKSTDFADLIKSGAMPDDILGCALPEAAVGDTPDDSAGVLAEMQAEESAAVQTDAEALGVSADVWAHLPANLQKLILKEAKGEKWSMVKELLHLAAAADLFHGPDGITYADVQLHGHRETMTIPGGLRKWLRRAYHTATQSAPGAEAMTAALGVLESRAEFDGPERTVFLRVGAEAGRMYLDLADATWRAVEIDAGGWRILQAAPVRFRRVSAMRALPQPQPGGSVELLRPFVNVASDDDWILLIAWLLAALREKGPFPVLALIGEQGSCKSTLTRMLRALVDPGALAERPFPREDRDVAIAADNAWVLSFGNLSNLSPEQSDAICRLSTGGGFATRGLYTDRDETVFEAMRPQILNGIAEFVTRPDLADRALLLHLDPIPQDGRRAESELWAEFEAARPRILGALLDATAIGLCNLSDLPPWPRLPRMADFAQWGRACEPGYTTPGAFMRAYEANRNGMVEATLDGDPIAAGVRELAKRVGGWGGTATELLTALAALHPTGDTRGPTLPKTAKGLSDKLRRLATFLRADGVCVELGSREGKARTRTIRLRVDSNDVGTSASAASASSACE